jgi:type II secretory pathway pseudopilin PulG
VPPQGQYPGQGQYPPAQYPPGYFPPPQQAPTDGKATASLVFGILSLICFGIFAGIPAIILGHLSRGEVKRSMGRLSGAGMALAGLIMGYASIGITVLFVSAIVIPNLYRARMVANESAAISTVRTINTSQVTYSTVYPKKGYAQDLATLGPGPSGSCSTGTEEHACLIDNMIGNARCTAGTWCAKREYKFSMSAETNCPDQTTQGTDSGVGCNYVIVATPVSGTTGQRSFCSTMDGVVRYHYGNPLSRPISAEECSRWSQIY